MAYSTTKGREAGLGQITVTTILPDKESNVLSNSYTGLLGARTDNNFTVNALRVVIAHIMRFIGG